MSNEKIRIWLLVVVTVVYFWKVTRVAFRVTCFIINKTCQLLNCYVLE